MGLSAEQMAFRAGKFGSSTAAKLVVGKEIDVFLELTGRDERTANDAMELGNDLERPIVETLFSRRVKPARMWQETLTHPKHAWAIATPDGRTEEPEIVEAKLVGGHNARGWGDDSITLPDYPFIQVQWQLGVSGLRVGHVAALIGSTTFRHYRIEADDELFGMLLERAERFLVDHVRADVPPAVDGSEGIDRYIASRFPRNAGGMQLATPDVDEIAKHLAAKRAEADALERAIKADEQTLKLAIGERDGIEGNGWKATYKATASGGVDWKGLAMKLGATPSLEREFTRPGSRRFLFTAKGAE